MKYKNKYSSCLFRRNKHLNLLDFGFQENEKKFLNKINKESISEINYNELADFIETTYNFTLSILDKYSSPFSKKTYTQPVLFTILGLKYYLNMSFRQITDFIEFSDKIKAFFKIKKAPNYSTLQKFFKRLPTNMFERITSLIIAELKIKNGIVALDGSGFTCDSADKYYSKIRRNERKHYTKCHIAIDTTTKIVMHSQALKGPRHDIKFAKASIRAMKKYKPSYILADKAYDTESIRRCINKELGSTEQIPLKSNFTHGVYRRKSQKTFQKEIYNQRGLVENVFSVIKRIFDGTNKSKSTRLRNKETRLKTLFYNIYRYNIIKN